MVFVAAAVVGAVATVATTASALSKKSPKPGEGPESTTESTSKLEFPAETRELIGNVEFPQIRSAFGEQSNLLEALLGGKGTNPFVQNQFGSRPLQAAQAATKRGGADAGINDLSSLDSLTALSPELVEAIKSLALQNASQRTSIVPTGFTPFLNPSSTSTSKSVSAPAPGPSAFDTGVKLAGGIANVAGAFNSGAKGT